MLYHEFKMSSNAVIDACLLNHLQVFQSHVVIQEFIRYSVQLIHVRALSGTQSPKVQYGAVLHF